MITGSLVALVTPFTITGKVDWISLSKLVDFQLTEGINAIVLISTTGESSTLTISEKNAIINYVVKKVNGRIPIIAGISTNSTHEAIILTELAKKNGADACLVVTPYYNKPTQTGLYKHFYYISTSVSILQIIYNVPSRTACDILPNTVAQLSKLPNIIGIKDSTGNLQRGKEILELVKPNFFLYSGDDIMAMELMLLGAKGNISVIANIAPKYINNLCHSILDGDTVTANKLNNKLFPLYTSLFVETNPIPVKWALYKMGLISKGIRLPLTWLNYAYHEQVKNALIKSEILKKKINNHE